VLAVTFTNKAAKEMLTRLGAMLPIPVRGMWVGTFHGLCNRFLRAHWKLSGLPQGFQILDSSDQLSAVKRVIKSMNLDEERYVPKQVTWAIAGAKEEGLRPKDMEVRDEHSRVIAQVYEGYEAQCQREGVVDFAELMLRTYELMRDNTALREHYQRRFRHILVDEFQDTNRLQYAWLKMFAGRRRRSSRSATTTRASMRSAARRSATWRRSSASSGSSRSSSSSATTARSATSSMPRTS
jgi:DNA helicase-2/ATP-dependent DNA helicase PcrA